MIALQTVNMKSIDIAIKILDYFRACQGFNYLDIFFIFNAAPWRWRGTKKMGDDYDHNLYLSVTKI